MSNEPTPPPNPDPPRRPFENLPEPTPFLRSPEFRRMIWFASLLLFVGLFLFYLLQTSARTAVETNTTAETKESAADPLTPKELEARATKLGTLFEGSLNDSQNGEAFRETQGYLRLLQLLGSYSSEEIAQRSTRRLDYAAVLRDPDAWRGEFLTTRGFIVYMRAVKLKEKVFGIGDVYRGYLVNPGADPKGDGEGLVFDLMDPPPHFESRRDPVEIEGLLYRTASYENEKGLQRVVPYFLARTLRVVEKPKVGSAGFLQDHGGTLLVLMGLAIFSGRLLVYVFQRRAQRRAPARPVRHAGFHEMFEQKQREDRRTSGPRPPA